ncbi:MAG: DinB family protein [Thermomicrobiales bacterium]|nr:DinB family protein [Thermomicrobiales bacterium]
MLLETLCDYHDYAIWANDRILTAAEGLTPEQFLQSGLPDVWPVRDTLVHMMWAQVIWLGRWGQDVAGLDPKKLKFPDVASVRTHWEKVDAVHSAFLTSIDASAFGSSDVTYTNQLKKTHTFPLPILVLHLGNHATYHRGEVAALLTSYGCSPGELDITRWLAANGRSS